jgi:ribosomal protein S12 methylthiotransferase
LGIWVRLHYVYPYPNVEQIMPLMNEGKILPYIDVPFQHASYNILKAMRRPASSERTLDQIQSWRKLCPELVIRSTFIVGFPGETEQDFDLLLSFLREAQLDRVGCFQYSPVQGAAANELGGEVADEVKQERWDRFMELQQEISEDKLEQRVGQTMTVLIDEVDHERAIARSYADAPEIDGTVQIVGEHDCQVGDLVEVIVEDANEYDLIAVLAY